jgi:hypothetical protein
MILFKKHYNYLVKNLKSYQIQLCVLMQENANTKLYDELKFFSTSIGMRRILYRVHKLIFIIFFEVCIEYQLHRSIFFFGRKLDFSTGTSSKKKKIGRFFHVF